MLIKNMKKCKVKNCQNKILTNGYCNKHYLQQQRHGKILERTIYDINKFINYDSYYKICLYNCQQKKVSMAKIDKKDYERVKNLKWGLTKQNYVYCNSIKAYLHQFILGRKKGFEIDHINHDKTDCRHNNLRFATRQQNSMNRKNVNGYCWDKREKKWLAKIMINYKTIHLGYFGDKQDAINARRQAEKKYFKEFAYKKYVKN